MRKKFVRTQRRIRRISRPGGSVKETTLKKIKNFALEKAGGTEKIHFL